MSDRPRAMLPILVLIVLTPLVAELSWGSLPIQVAYALPFLVPVYGCGALLARELVRRTGRGWASLLLLGVAYEVVEDGFGLRAMFSPHTYHAAQWGARVLGVNWAYTEFNMIYHVAFTIAVPILITELMFPARRHQPYLRTRGLVITAVAYLLGVAILRLAVAPNAPGANTADAVPVGHLIVAGTVVLALGLTALLIVPKPTHRPIVPGTPPPPWLIGVAVAAGTVLALRLTAPLGAAGDPHPLFGAGWPVLAQIAGSLAVTAVVLTILWRSSLRTGWSRRHLVAVAGGALLAHTIVGASLFASTNPAELITLAVFALLEAALIIALYQRRLDSRPASSDQQRAHPLSADPISDNTPGKDKNSAHRSNSPKDAEEVLDRPAVSN
ncbi:hypothetical protein [Spelaeicoccus albus]|uniref:Uncharacterized protein n=1 Tax=Spelaeicoccus albus TaxID=1280376 RepID=A0A7Z0D1L3_9MICO|nr:hypothetical protein [Spelaeicoccus albus]NYI66280.1 hypothetical protein [Spelaeicoccus albus]